MSRKNIQQSKIDLHKFDTRYELAKKFLEALKWVYIAKYIYKSIKALAGKVTLANLNFKAAYNQQAAESSLTFTVIVVIFAIMVAFLSIVYGLRQSKLKKDTVEKLTIQISTLEKIIDQNRSSSKLTTRGETSEKDKL